MTHCLEVCSSLSFTRAAHLRTLIVVGIVSLAPSLGLGQDSGAPRKVTTVEGITEYALDNGYRPCVRV